MSKSDVDVLSPRHGQNEDSTNVAVGSPFDPAGSPESEFGNALKFLLRERPKPLRIYDQIHMRIEDLVAHLLAIGPKVAGKDIFFMGDSDGVALGLAYGASRGLFPAPRHLVLGDFDERVLQHVAGTAETHGFQKLITTRLYNVFDPLPSDLWETADFFHTNPPYGRYNGGRSVEAFVERCLAATRAGGSGLVILANDYRYAWTKPVLRNVLSFLLSKEVTPSAIQERCHRYYLDDEPELESGFIYCTDVQPEYAVSPHRALPAVFKRKFYGRRTIRIPRSIGVSDAQQLLLNF